MTKLSLFERCMYCDVLVDPNLLEGVKKVFTSGETKDLVDPYLMFDFAGVRVSWFIITA